MTTEFDPSNLSGFPAHLFTVLGRFRDVAVDNHMDTGESLEDVQYHETAIVDGNTLLNTYEPPVVFSVFSGYDSEADTVAKQTDTFTVRLIATVVNNVEQNRSLTKPDGTDPVAEDVTWSGIEPDFQFSDNEDMVLHWCSVSFSVTSRRLKPT